MIKKLNYFYLNIFIIKNESNHCLRLDKTNVSNVQDEIGRAHV
jgi:hypothetical protein